jgi:KTSC domain
MSRHLLPHFHWCAGCWKWVCDCIHCVDPLPIQRESVKDLWIRSLGYDRRRGRLEIEFTWTADVRQFHPISPVLYRELLRARPMYLFLDQKIMRARWIRSQYVRTEEKRAMMMVGIANQLLGET